MQDSNLAKLSDEALIEKLLVAEDSEADGSEAELNRLCLALSARLTNDPKRLEAALGSLQRRDAPEHSEAYWTIVRAGHASEPEQLFQTCAVWSTHADPFWRRSAIDILAQLGRERPMRDASLPIIVRQLDDDDETVVASALYAIGQLAPQAPVYEAATLQRLAALTASNSVEVRRAAVSALMAPSFPDGIDLLIVLSRDEDREVRDWATFGLGTISTLDTPAIRDALVARLEDEDVETRHEAMLGLAVRKDARADATIRRELEEDRFSSLVAEAIAERPNSQYVALLESYLGASPDDADIGKALQSCRSARDRNA